MAPASPPMAESRRPWRAGRRRTRVSLLEPGITPCGEHRLGFLVVQPGIDEHALQLRPKIVERLRRARRLQRHRAANRAVYRVANAPATILEEDHATQPVA